MCIIMMCRACASCGGGELPDVRGAAGHGGGAERGQRDLQTAGPAAGPGRGQTAEHPPLHLRTEHCPR